MSTRSKSSAIGLLALAAIVVAVAVTTAGASSKNHAVKLHPRRSPVVSARLRQMFEVLDGTRRARSASVGASYEPLPAAVAQGMSSQGMDPNAAVFVGGTFPAWVVPGASEVCLVVGTTGPNSVPSADCATIAASESGLALVTRSAGQPVVLGLVPNGNTSVQVTNTNGTKESIPVTNNVYEITKGKPSSVTLRGASGASTTEPTAISPAPPATAPAPRQ
jgi:hypothetical protein